MHTTRRVFLGTVATSAAMAATPPAKSLTAKSGPQFYVAAVTPCDARGKFDEALYRDLMTSLKERGADGVVVLGTTGEFPSFSVAERKRIAETALKHRAGLRMIVQVGTPNLPETLELLNHATGSGADGVLCIPPFYFKNPGVDGLVKYYSPILETSKIPVYLYHIPGTSAVPISLELLHKLEHYPTLAGIKDSTGNAEGYAAFVKEFPKLDMMTGTDNNLPHALSHNMGAILAGGNLFTRQSAAVFAAHRAGKPIDEAFAKLREASALMRGASGAPGIKFGLTAFGLRESYVRPPQQDLTPEQKEQYRPKLAELAKLA